MNGMSPHGRVESVSCHGRVYGVCGRHWDCPDCVEGCRDGVDCGCGRGNSVYPGHHLRGGGTEGHGEEEGEGEDLEEVEDIRLGGGRGGDRGKWFWQKTRTFLNAMVGVWRVGQGDLIQKMFWMLLMPLERSPFGFIPAHPCADLVKREASTARLRRSRPRSSNKSGREPNEARSYRFEGRRDGHFPASQ